MVNKCLKMNTKSERLELILLWLMMPVWAFVLPAACVGYFGPPDNLLVRAILLTGCFFCSLHFLHLTNNKFVFGAKGVRLAGVDHRVVPYSNIRSVQIDSNNAKELMVTLTPLHWLPGTTTKLPDEARLYEAPSEEVAQEVVTELSRRIASPAQIT